jgi:FKBP-type peptidyl-prolyl cis-trans isomerase FklB
MLRTVSTRLLILACFTLLAATPVFAAEGDSALKTQKDKESYSIGYQVGQSMKADGVEVDFDKLIQGLQDAVKDKEPSLSTEEMRKLIVDLKKKSREVQMRKMQEQIVQNAQESEKFLAENKKKEGVKTTESGLQYKVMKEGTGVTPGPEDFVKVHYRGTFIGGKEFDNSYAKGEPQKFQTDGVIKGWTEALPMMKVGSKWQLFVPPDLAYGRSGLPNRIPPNKVLVFEIELLGIEKGDKTAQKPSAAQTSQKSTVRKMNITGEIGKAEHGYIIRGKQPQMIWTILNPDPNILDGFVQSEKTVPMEVRIVSGDNVDIVKIDGKAYSVQKGDKTAQQSGVQTSQKSTVRKMSLTGEIGKMQNGYIIRSKKGNVLSEIYTILNPDPKVLDEFVKSEKTVPIEVRIVSGDNVNIEKIDGKKYP